MPLTAVIGFLTTFFSVGMAITLTDQGVQCDPRQMHVFFDFAEPFVGVVYAKDHQNDESCRVYGTGARKLSLSVLLNVDSSRKPFCGVRLNKAAHEFSVQLLINNARDILVDGLSEFEVRCVYHLKDVTVKLPSVAGGLKISAAENNDRDLTVIESAGAGLSPLMDMEVRFGHGIDGQSVQSALIGQPITLDVFTDSTGGAYDFFLYNCLAHNGKRSVSGTVTLLDNNGCAVVVDRVLTDPVKVSTAENGSKHVFLHLRGFQFSDSDLVYFECQVRPCLNECNTTQCQSDTSKVPRLEPLKKWSRPLDEENRTVMQSREQDGRQALSVQTKVAIRSRRQLDQPLIVGASEVDNLLVDDPDFLTNENNDEICIPKVLVVSVIILFLLGCAFVFAISMYTWYKMRRERDDKHKSAPRTGANVFSSSLCD